METILGPALPMVYVCVRVCVIVRAPVRVHVRFTCASPYNCT